MDAFVVGGINMQAISLLRRRSLFVLAAVCLAALLALVTLSAPHPATAEGVAGASSISAVEMQKLIAPDRDPGDQYGFNVAVDGGTAIVGACFDDDKGMDSGSAYVYTRSADGSWSLRQELTASDGAAGEGFGMCVDIDGDTVVVAAGVGGPGAGGAYVFFRGADGQLVRAAEARCGGGSR